MAIRFSNKHTGITSHSSVPSQSFLLLLLERTGSWGFVRQEFSKSSSSMKVAVVVVEVLSGLQQ